MKIIISPAKKMKTIDDINMECTTPIFLSKTDELLQHLQNLSYTDLKSYLKCSDSIAKNHRGKRDILSAFLNDMV